MPASLPGGRPRTPAFTAAVAISTFTFLLPGVALPARAAPPTHDWTRTAGGTLADFGVDAAADGSGNVIVTGSFQGTIDFGGGPLTSLGDREIFLAKFDGQGAHVWSKRFGAAALDQGEAVGVDGTGAIYAAGFFSGTVDFGGGPLTSPVESDDIYLAKFDANGQHVWSKRFGGVQDEAAYDLAMDSASNCYLTGSFRTSIDFGSGALTSSGNRDAFLAKFSPSGSCLWAKRFGGTGNDLGACLVADPSGGTALVIEPGTDLDLGGGMLDVGTGFAFGRFDAGGAHTWSRTYGANGGGGGGSSSTREIAVDASGAFAIAGYFAGTCEFGGGPIQAWGPLDGFLAKYTPEGNPVWSKRLGGSSGGDDACATVIAMPNDRLIVTGYFTGTANFGGATLASAGFEDAFYAGFDSDGVHEWSFRVGGSSWDESGVALVPGSGGSLGVAGVFGGMVDFGDGIESAAGSWDIYLSKYQDAATGAPLLSPETSTEAQLETLGPNPTRGHARLALVLPRPNAVELRVLDVTGRLVRRLARGAFDAGSHGFAWDLADERGRRVPSGVYFVRGVGEGIDETRRVVVTR